MTHNIQIQAFDKHVEIIDKDMVKCIPYADVIKWHSMMYNKKYVVRIAHKNGLYMMYSEDKIKQELLMSILDKKCGVQS